MFGTSMGYGYQPGPKNTITKKYAWMPVKTDSQKWIWLDSYYKISSHRYTFDTHVEVLSKKEYLVWIIKYPKTEPVPPASGSAVVR